MSYPFKPQSDPGSVPRKRIGNTFLTGLSIAALFAAAHSTWAGGVTKVKAEVTVGFPHGQVTVERTIYRSGHEDDENCDRDDGQRQIVVNREDESCSREKEVVVRKVVEPGPCDHVVREVVYERPAYSRVVIVRPREEREIRIIHEHHRFGRHAEVSHHRHEEAAFHGDRDSHSARPEVRHEQRPSEQHPHNLFNTPSARPSRERGAQR